MAQELEGRKNARFLLWVLLCCSGVANAQEWYAGAGIGLSRADNLGACSSSNGLSAGFSCSGNSSTGWRLFAGYEINRNLAVEGSYVDLGEFNQSAQGSATGAPPGNTATTRSTGKPIGLSVDAVATWLGNEQSGVIARVGILVWSLDSRMATTFNGINTTTSHNTPTGASLDIGVGLKHDFDKNLGVRVELQRFLNVGDDTTGKAGIYLLSASLVYRFSFRSSFY